MVTRMTRICLSSLNTAEPVIFALTWDWSDFFKSEELHLRSSCHVPRVEGEDPGNEFIVRIL